MKAGYEGKFYGGCLDRRCLGPSCPGHLRRNLSLRQPMRERSSKFPLLAIGSQQRAFGPGPPQEAFRYERRAALAALQKVAVKIDCEMSALAFTKLSVLAEQHQLSVYDAAYLELAQRRKLALACKDGPLQTAARRAQIKVL